MIFYLVSIVLLVLGVSQSSNAMIVSAGLFAIASGIFYKKNNESEDNKNGKSDN